MRYNFKTSCLECRFGESNDVTLDVTVDFDTNNISVTGCPKNHSYSPYVLADEAIERMPGEMAERLGIIAKPETDEQVAINRARIHMIADKFK